MRSAPFSARTVSESNHPHGVPRGITLGSSYIFFGPCDGIGSEWCLDDGMNVTSTPTACTALLLSLIGACATATERTTEIDAGSTEMDGAASGDAQVGSDAEQLADAADSPDSNAAPPDANALLDLAAVDAGPHECEVLSGVAFGPHALSSGFFGLTLSTTIPPSRSGDLYARLEIILSPASSTAPLPALIDLRCLPEEGCLEGSQLTSGRASVYGEQFAAVAGTAAISASSWPESAEAAGELRDLEFRQLDTRSGRAEEYHVVPGGDCFVVPTVSFDTRVHVGDRCVRKADCGALHECSWATMTCVVPECVDAGSACVGGGTCEEFPELACRKRCGLFDAAACPDTHACTNDGTGLSWCLPIGTASAGEPCDAHEDAWTGCGPGLYCGAFGGEFPFRCTQRCDPYAMEAECAPDLRCDPTRTACLPPRPSVPLLGEECAFEGEQCDDDGYTYRGTCANVNPPWEISSIRCLPSCNTGLPGHGCGAGASCTQPFLAHLPPELGVCQPTT